MIITKPKIQNKKNKIIILYTHFALYVVVVLIFKLAYQQFHIRAAELFQVQICRVNYKQVSE